MYMKLIELSVKPNSPAFAAFNTVSFTWFNYLKK